MVKSKKAEKKEKKHKKVEEKTGKKISKKEIAEKNLKKEKKSEAKLEKEIEEVEEELTEISEEENASMDEGIDSDSPSPLSAEQRAVEIKASKPVAQIKKGDKIKVDGKEYEVDQHYVLIDHGTTKEMAIECFDSKADKDYQLRYFMDQVETTIEFYELQEILFIKKVITRVEW